MALTGPKLRPCRPVTVTICSEVLDEAKAENRQGFSAGSLLLFKQERNLFYPMEEDGVITGGIQNKGIAIQFEGQKHSFV